MRSALSENQMNSFSIDLPQPKLKIFSFFAGIGFLDLGFEMSGIEVVYINEVNPAFLSGYQYSRSRLGLSQPEYGYDCDDASKILMVYSEASVILQQNARSIGAGWIFNYRSSN